VPPRTLRREGRYPSAPGGILDFYKSVWLAWGVSLATVAKVEFQPENSAIKLICATSVTSTQVTKPIVGGRRIGVPDRSSFRRTWRVRSQEVDAFLERSYADCASITLVCNNLNTYTPSAFYEVCEPEKAR
jgi:hypothetical protein